MTRPSARLALLVGFFFPVGLLYLPFGGNGPARNRTPVAPINAEHALIRADVPTETSIPTPTDSPTPEGTPSPTETQTSTPDLPPSETATASAVVDSATPSTTASLTPPADASHTPSPTAIQESRTPTPSGTMGPTSSPAPNAAVVLINEVAWAGTLASANDEWIELYNPGSEPVDLGGWSLTDNGDIAIALLGVIPPHSFFLLERTDDSSVSDIAADEIYTGNLSNAGESLWLTDSDDVLTDSANASGGAWPAGNSSTRASMERRGGADISSSWGTFSGVGGAGHDAAGNPIFGTPRNVNSPTVMTPTPTPTPTPLATTSQPPPQAVMINEVAWSGTKASSSDEWIELHNPGAEPIDLSGWFLSDGGDIHVSLKGGIEPGGFFLLERTDDTTISDITADLFYTGSLSNNGETLELRDPAGRLVDSANADGGGWPAGIEAGRGSMERRGGDDRPSNWASYTGYHGIGHDAEGSAIRGTPRSTNSVFFPTPEPTSIPGRVVINEVLMRPHYDWQGTGGVTTADEFIELYNLGPGDVNLAGWTLDDIGVGGSKPYTFDDKVIPAGGYLTMFRSRTHLALNDDGDNVRLSAPGGRLIDKVVYLKVTAYNLSYGRLPDGSRHFLYGLWPTPNAANILFVEPEPILRLRFPGVCPAGGYPRALVPRLARRPAQARYLAALGLVRCP